MLAHNSQHSFTTQVGIRVFPSTEHECTASMECGLVEELKVAFTCSIEDRTYLAHQISVHRDEWVAAAQTQPLQAPETHSREDN